MIKKAAQVIIIASLMLFCSSNIFAVSTFIKYPQNPILQNGQNPSIIKDNNQYKMWYDVNYGQGWRVNYAYSPDGINNWVIPYQTILPVGSTDNFEKETSNPYVLYNPSSHLYQMWYTGIGQNWSGGPDRFRLGYATSPDGINWTKYDWILKGTEGSWDSGGIARGESIIYKDGIYQIWYAATDEGFNWKIGYATSPNGIDWTKGNNGLPVVTPTEPWELTDVEYPNVIFNNGVYEMFYGAGPSDNTTQLIYATSTNGINWIKPSEINPILIGTQGGRDGITMTGPSAMRLNNGTTMLWYAGNVSDIMLAMDGPIATPSPTPTPTPTPTPMPVTKVVVAPGMGASWNADAILHCKKDNYTGGWTLSPFATDIYTSLLNSLSKSFTVLPYYYDWRQQLPESAIRLKNFINTSASAGEKVHLVGHSMGGLVGRSYLVNEQTNNKLSKFMTVGSPHQGLPLAYPAWSAGEIWQDDYLTRIAATLLVKSCELYQGQVNDRIAIQENIPSTQNLLPMFDYLKDYLTGLIKPENKMHARNNWASTAPLVPPFYGVTLGTLSGNEYKTLNIIDVINRNKIDEYLGNWEDGKPKNKKYSQLGDGTVLLSSSQVSGSSYSAVIKQSHNNLVSSQEGISQINNFLKTASTSAESSLTAFVESTSALLIVGDPSDFWITDTNGKIMKDKDGIVIINNPKKGFYKLRLLPKSSDTRIAVGQFFDNGTVLWKEYKQKYFIPKLGTINYNPDAPVEDALK